MAVGHSDDIEPEDAVATVVAECDRALAGAKPVAGLLFLAYDNDPTPFLSGVRAAYPDVELIGSTSMGEMSSTLGFREDSVTLALFASDARGHHRRRVDRRRVGSRRRRPASHRARAGEDRAGATPVRRTAVGRRREPDGGAARARSKSGRSGPHPRGRFRTTGRRRDAVRTAVRRRLRAEDAVTILLFSGPLSYSFGIDTGWRPVGRTGTVTDASGFTIRTIDGEPATRLLRAVPRPRREADRRQPARGVRRRSLRTFHFGSRSRPIPIPGPWTWRVTSPRAHGCG